MIGGVRAREAKTRAHHRRIAAHRTGRAFRRAVGAVPASRTHLYTHANIRTYIHT